MAMRRFVSCFLAIAAAAVIGGTGTKGSEVVDPTRPVARISRDSVTIQYFTAEPCETRVQIRRGELSATMMKWREGEEESADVWAGEGVREVEGGGEATTIHRVTIDGLEAGARYYYRVFDPACTPMREEMDWGAAAPWRREYAVSTLAPAGMKTVIRYPVRVLLMPNVINVESAHDADGAIAPEPERFSEAQLALIRAELDAAARFLFVNSHMRFWPDFHVYVDDRWQRWGPEPANAGDFYAGWPECRSYAGEDYHQPGGGRFTILDTTDVERVTEDPVREEMVYPAQVEIAFPRRWKPEENRWWYYTSGGGTLGPDSLPRGIPGRSQFFGGYDTCWLMTHEFHHQMEALGAISLAFREDDRIVYNHWSPRSRERGPDAASGKEGVRARHAWSTSGPHGEHYDGMAYWDRTLTDAQWLRMLLGETATVVDKDEDGFPDDDARLPLDERRFGSSPASPATDGRMGDLQKAMLSTWAPAPLQVSFGKPEQVFTRPDPLEPDSDGDGWGDGEDAAPLVPHEPFVWPLTATVDGDAAEWAAIEPSGVLESGEMRVEFRQAHDDEAWYGCIVATGPWVRLRVVHDGEGKGAYSMEGIQSFFVYNGEPGRISPTFMGTSGDMEWKTARRADGALVVEYAFRNWAPKGWFWRRGGRAIGTQIEAYDHEGAALSMYEPYRLFYCTMLERAGAEPMPADAPGELAAAEADLVLLPGDERLKTAGEGWTLIEGADGRVFQHSGFNEAAVYVDGLSPTGEGITGDFDLWVRMSGKRDGILGAFTPGTQRLGAVHDYVVFVGGYSNTRTRFRLFGQETSDSVVMMSEGEHTMQLSRRDRVVWALFDGKPILWATDPHPDSVVDRLAAIGGYGGEQVLLEMRVRVGAGENGK